MAANMRDVVVAAGTAVRFDRIREHLTWWERKDRPHADGGMLAMAIRAIVDPEEKQ